MRKPGQNGFDPGDFLLKFEDGKTARTIRARERIFSQGEPAGGIYFLQTGKVELRVLSREGKEAVLGILDGGNFFGEGCLAGQTVRMATAVALTECSVIQVEKPAMVRILHQESRFSAAFVTYLLSRNLRIEEDLIDQLFNSSEKRLARILLLLANFGKEGEPQPLIPHISQATLAEMIGTTRSRVSFFMNKFRKLGFIEYNGRLHIHAALLNVILHD